MTPESNSRTAPPSTRQIAELAGVSTATVSRALRGSSRVRPETRERVMAVADELGYRPNAILASLSASRFQRGSRNAPPLAMISQSHTREAKAHLDAFLPCCRDLGYQLQLFHYDDHPDPAAFSQMLYNRGVQGLFLLTPFVDEDYRAQFDVRPFAVIALSESQPASEFHLVRQTRLNGFLKLWQLAAKRGYQRIGAVLYQDPNRIRQEDQQLIAGAAYSNLNLPKNRQVPPLIFQKFDNETLAAQIEQWRLRYAPDAIIAFNLAVTHNIRDREKLGIGVMASGRQDTFTGYHRAQWKVARQAAALMDTLIRSGARGVPADRFDLVVEPEWVEGVTLPPVSLAKDVVTRDTP